MKFRCPQCKKLFQVESTLIHSKEPEFECSKCFCRFSFSYPPSEQEVSGGELRVRTLSLPQVKKLNSVNTLALPPAVLNSGALTGEVIPCPKCQAKNPRLAKECFKCGVIFARYQKNMPALLKSWQEVLHDYNSIEKHHEFIDRCEKAHSLAFAMKKYQALKEAQPQDPVAQQLFNVLLMKTFASGMRKSNWQSWMEDLAKWIGQDRAKKFEQWMESVPWANIARVSPVALGGLMLVIGLMNHGSRNLFGAGIAVLVLSLGFTYFLRGRIHWSDFWRSR